MKASDSGGIASCEDPAVQLACALGDSICPIECTEE